LRRLRIRRAIVRCQNAARSYIDANSRSTRGAASDRAIAATDGPAPDRKAPRTSGSSTPITSRSNGTSEARAG